MPLAPRSDGRPAAPILEDFIKVHEPALAGVEVDHDRQVAASSASRMPWSSRSIELYRTMSSRPSVNACCGAVRTVIGSPGSDHCRWSSTRKAAAAANAACWSSRSVRHTTVSSSVAVIRRLAIAVKPALTTVTGHRSGGRRPAGSSTASSRCRAPRTASDRPARDGTGRADHRAPPSPPASVRTPASPGRRGLGPRQGWRAGPP